MSDESPQVLPQVDSDPSGEFIDTESFFENVSEEEIADGNHLGEAIDTDDDEDSGARETYR